MPSFHADLVKGVATYALELFSAVRSRCRLRADRHGLGDLWPHLGPRPVGLADAHHRRGGRAAPAVALSFEQGRLLNTNAAATFADGMACRVPGAEPVAIIRRGAARVVRVTEDEIAEAIRAYYTDTHNVAEGAGAAPLAALLKERSSMQGKRIGLILSGGNIDREPFADVLAGNTPRP